MKSKARYQMHRFKTGKRVFFPMQIRKMQSSLFYENKQVFFVLLHRDDSVTACACTPTVMNKKSKIVCQVEKKSNM